MSFDRLFRSDRLVYRALSNDPEDKAFIRDVMMNDPTTYAQSTSRLLAPPRTEDIDKDMVGLAKAILAVMICLPTEPASVKADNSSSQHAVAGSGSAGQSPPASFTTIGWLSLDAHALTRHHRNCTLGIMLATSYQGQGYGAEAVRWSLDWAFGVAGMHAVRLACFSFNKRAVKFYERLGFVKEGLRRESYQYGSQWYDHVLFGMLEDEWASLKGTESI